MVSVTGFLSAVFTDVGMAHAHAFPGSGGRREIVGESFGCGNSCGCHEVTLGFTVRFLRVGEI